MTETLILLSIYIGLIGISVGLALSNYKRNTMAPLTKKGEKIKRALQKEYGKEKGKSILYAMENKGTVKGVTKKTAKKKATTKKKK